MAGRILCTAMEKMMRILLVFCMVFSLEVNATTKTALVNGNWESNSTWSGGTAPQCGDSIVIPVNKTVTITTILDYSACASAMKITVSGTLAFQSGKKLKMPCDSRFYVYSTGLVSPGGGGGSSNLIDICNTTVWTASSGSLSGTNCLPPDPVCGNFTLPVEFLGLQALNSGKSVTVKWSTASEKDNDYFTVERSDDGSEYYAIARIKGKGTSHIVSNYIYTDTDPVNGISYYRIKQTDFNGMTGYSEVVSLRRSKAFELTVYPNPANEELIIADNGSLSMDAVLSLYDISGKCVLSKNFREETLILNDLNKVEPGIYILKITDQESLYTERIAIRH